MKRRTKSMYYRELSKKNSERAKRGWKTRYLKMQAEAGQWESWEDTIARAKIDRKGKLYDIWTKTTCVSVEIYHSLDGRSDQYDVVIFEPKKWSEGLKQRKINRLSMPKLLDLWQNL